MSFVEKIQQSQKENVFLVKGKYQGRYVWHYIYVLPNKRSIFLREIDSENCDIKEYGEILHSGWGKTVPTEIADKFS